MIYEFAVEPTALNNWQTFRYIIDKCGIAEGRLISKFPGKWKRMVYEACGGCREIERKRIEQRLIDIDSLLVRSNREYIQASWLENAEAQQLGNNPFRAILASSNPRNNQSILLADEIDRNNPLWNVPRALRVNRKADILIECASLLLHISKEIIIVDPHFDFVDRRTNKIISRFYKTIEGIIKKSFINKIPSRIELHVKKKSQSDKNDKETQADFDELCQNKLAPIVPQDSFISVYTWKENMTDSGDNIHRRYILTERGGVAYDVGLDEGRREGETTDVYLLDQSLYEQRWRDYQQGTTTFELVNKILIQGSCKSQPLPRDFIK
jgi:hypothetical protein